VDALTLVWVLLALLCGLLLTVSVGWRANLGGLLTVRWLRAIAAHVAKWQEVYLWKPVLLGAMVFAYYRIGEMDPRSGIDGFGPLWGMLIVLFAHFTAAFGAWLVHNAYFRKNTDEDEEQLQEIATGNVLTLLRASNVDEHALQALLPTESDMRWRAVHALVLITLDRLTWFGVWLVLFIKLVG
jgi:hypothetical protein